MKRTGIDTEEPDEPDEPEDHARWLAAGFGSGEAAIWRRWRFTIARAEAWKGHGIDEGLVAAQWQTAGATPETVGDWLGAGIDAAQAVRWHELGFSLEQAKDHKRHGRGPADAFGLSNPQQPHNVFPGRGRWVSTSPARRSVLVGGAAMGMAGPFHQFQQSGADPRVIHGYIQRGWTDGDAVEWARHGVEAQDAYTWFDLGLTPAEAGRLTREGHTPGEVVRQWWRAGIPFEEVAEWIGAGLSVAEALDQRANGATMEHAASLRALRDEDDVVTPRDPRHYALWARMGPPGTDVIGPPPDDLPAALAAVEAAFGGLLTADEDGGVPTVDRGSNLGQCLQEAADRHGVVQDSPPAATVKTDAVRFVNDHEARVLYSVHVGAALNQTFGGRIGRALFVDGAWKVARETFSDFMQMAGVVCPPPP